jgi:hypothetical protein
MPELIEWVRLDGKTELTKWVSFSGKTYCWDKAAHKVVEVKISDVPLDEIPKEMLVAMIDCETPANRILN